LINNTNNYPPILCVLILYSWHDELVEILTILRSKSCEISLRTLETAVNVSRCDQSSAVITASLLLIIILLSLLFTEDCLNLKQVAVLS